MSEVTEDNNYLVPRNTEDVKLPQLANCVMYFSKMFFQYFTDINCWIAGGAVRDYFLQGYINKDSDVDFFGPDRTELSKLICFLRKYFQFKHFLITKNAIKGFGMVGKERINIDVVKVLFKDPLQTIDNFDFTVTCFAVDRNKSYYHPSAPFDLLRKRLVVNSLPFPLSSLQRMQKYIKRDYWICNGGMLEIAKALGSVEWTNPEQNNIEMYPDGSPRFVRID